MGENLALTEGVYYILLALCQPQHGYGVMQTVQNLSGGRVRLAPGTLYGALSSLCARGWIRALPPQAESRRKEYVITPQGQEALGQELARLRELLRSGERILGGNEHGRA